jgi:hypothetical protein
MWQPEPGWQRLPGAGPSTFGVWSAIEDGREIVVKRLAAPEPSDPPGLRDPGDANYWRRAADVALSGVVRRTPGLREAPVVRIEEDEDGVTVVHERVAGEASGGLFIARSLGRFAGADLGREPWLATGQLRTRLGLVERRGGWLTLARTPTADIAHHLWTRRETWLSRCDGLPRVAQHGDPVAANVPGREGDDAVAIDWSHLGTGPVGADLGYLSLSSREGFEPLLDAYLVGLPDELATREEAELGARVTAVYTALTRVDWALGRVADGEGALAGKFRHPAVAPYIMAMQRQVTQIEALLG